MDFMYWSIGVLCISLAVRIWILPDININKFNRD